MLARHGLDAGAEGRAGEQDGLTAAVHRVLRQARKALVHHGVQAPSLGGQVGREAVVQQVHALGLGPVARQGGVDGLHRMGQCMDEGDAHGQAAFKGVCGRGALVMRRPCVHHTIAASSSAGR